VLLEQSEEVVAAARSLFEEFWRSGAEPSLSRARTSMRWSWSVSGSYELGASDSFDVIVVDASLATELDVERLTEWRELLTPSGQLLWIEEQSASPGES